MRELLDRIKGKRVTVCGDVMLDRYVSGEVQRISPEAPVPVLKAIGVRETPGGAANVAQNIHALGGIPLLIGRIGRDAPGKRLRFLLSRQGISPDFLVEDPHVPTTVKTRFLSGIHQLLRVDEEKISPPDLAVQKKLLSCFQSCLKQTPAGIFSDYDKGLARGIGKECVRLAELSQVRLIVDPKPGNAHRFVKAYLMAPNVKEAGEMAGTSLDSQEKVQETGEILRKKLHCRAFLITQGSGGMTLFEARRPPRHFPVPQREVYDVTGAGDTVMSALGLALSGGASLAEAVQLANYAAAIVVQKPGTAVATPAEILVLARGNRSKILSLPELLPILKDVRRKGGTVVFTNGVFDLLHSGHVAFLSQARSLGEVLVVGVNSDASAKKVKGKGRPLQSQEARGQILASLQAVDFIVYFDEPTPLRLIRHLRPHILVKGGDYSPEQVVGKSFVESYGGKVVILPYISGHSTRGLIQKIRSLP